MVRTRSGKVTTKQEKIEDALKSPPKKKSAEKKGKKVRHSKKYQFLVDLCFWKPTDKTHTFWSCILGTIFLALASFSVNNAVWAKYPDFYFFQMLIAIHWFDLLTNFCNELVGRGHLNDEVLFTEAAVNITEAFLFLFYVHQSANLFITAVVVLTFVVLGLNIKYKNEDRVSVRLMAYSALMCCSPFLFAQSMQNGRISIYFSLLFISMIVDAFDFPDKYFKSLTICEGTVIFSRALGTYFLITAQLVQQAGYTNIEQFIKGLFGM